MSQADHEPGQEPDAIENTTAAANDDHPSAIDAVEFNEGAHINSPLNREARLNMATLAATFDPEGYANDDKGKVKEALAAASSIIDQNERMPHKTGFSSGDHAKRIAQIRKKRIPQTTTVRELSRLPQNKSDAETGLEIGKQAWRGMMSGILSARKDAEAVKDAKLAEELAEAQAAQKEVDRREREAAESKDGAKTTASSKADARKSEGIDGADDVGGGGSDGNGGPSPDGTPPSTPPSTPSSKLETKTDRIGLAETVVKAGVDAATLSPAASIATTAATNVLSKDREAQKLPQMGIPKNADPAALGPEPLTRGLSLAISPNAMKPGEKNSELQANAPARSLKANARQGPLFEQARALPKVAAPVQAIGPQSPPPRPRAQGLGISLSSFVKAARVFAPRENGELSAAAWMQQRREADGLGK